MKKIFLILFVFAFTFSSCTLTKYEQKENQQIQDEEFESVKGLWLSVFDMDFLHSDESEFTDKTDKEFSEISRLGFNNIFVQVRPFCDALYESDIFPWSSYLTGVQGKSSGFDPLEIMVENAHKYNLKIHAWLNPYRILRSKDISQLDENSPALRFIREKTDDVYIGDTGTYFNPASVNAQKIILDGVREIAEKYDVDGIHIDDYFYPSTDKKIDENEYKIYEGDLSLCEWRLANVNNFVSGMYSAVKSIDDKIIVSISPSGNIDYNYNYLYADVKSWLSCKGYADWIIPQIYFGFENETSPFAETVDKWKELATNSEVKLMVGLAMYKSDSIDENAGSGSREWLESQDIISHEIDYVKNSDCSGFVLYSYGSLYNAEWENCKDKLVGSF